MSFEKLQPRHHGGRRDAISIIRCESTINFDIKHFHSKDMEAVQLLLQRAPPADLETVRIVLFCVLIIISLAWLNAVVFLRFT
jgi:hypothetical protein